MIDNERGRGMHDHTPNDTQNDTPDAIQDPFISTSTSLPGSPPVILVHDDMSAEQRGRYNFQRMMYALFFPRASLLRWQAG